MICLVALSTDIAVGGLPFTFQTTPTTNSTDVLLVMKLSQDRVEDRAKQDGPPVGEIWRNATSIKLPNALLTN